MLNIVCEVVFGAIRDQGGIDKNVGLAGETVVGAGDIIETGNGEGSLYNASEQ
jgi:hypothetical protein